MKKFYLLLLAAGAFCLAGCVSPAVNVPKAESAEKKEPAPIKTGFFVDKGSYDGGVLRVAQLLYHSPQLEVTLLNGEDIRNGKLDNLELLVVPGGSSAKQFKMITAGGAAKVREFVKKGGNYVGVCAGFHCTLNRPDRFALLPYTYIHNTSGAQAPLKVKISDKGAAILNVKPGKYTVYYSGGPISKAGNWEHGKAEVLGEYLSVVGREGRLYNFVNHPAILFGNYGKGKVAATSFHPEVYSGTHCIFNGMIYAVSGRKITQNFPAKNYRPVRVGMYTGNVENKARILRFIELDRHPDIDVKNVSASSIYQDSLVRFDVLVTMNSDTKNFRAFVKKHDAILRAFLARGGKIVAGGSGVKALPVHKNVIGIPAGVSFVDAVLKR